MQIIKIIVGLSYLVLAFWSGLFAWGSFFSFGFISLLPAVFSVAFAVMGCFLILKRKSKLGKTGGSVVTVVTCFLWIYIIAIIIPNFVAMRYERSSNTCVNNLRQLQAAKTEWALETGATNGAPVIESDITPYISLDSNGNIPKCPAGGTYILGRVGEDVRCSIGTADWPNRHTLLETNNFSRWDDFKEAYGILLGLRHVRSPD